MTDNCQYSVSLKRRCMCNTVKDLNFVLNHGPSYHFNIKITENITFLTPI